MHQTTIGGIYNTSAPTLADGQTYYIGLDSRGRVLTNGTVVGNSTATIANGTSLSGAVDLGAGAALVGIQMPAAWTAASLTFQVSADGVTYANKYDAYGSEYTIPSASAAASQYIAIPPSDFFGVRYIKVRSGTSGAAVNQGASRDLTLVAAS